jgi:hypothetical protein
MGLPCKQCKESFSPDEIFEFLYCDEGIYFFCTKECTFDINVFICQRQWREEES